MKIDKIIEKMDQNDLKTIIILKPENIAYVTGFYPSSIAILILKDEPCFFPQKWIWRKLTKNPA
nr:aminopeptidase P family N-terminal domain-containing protein [Methanobacterium formicicum]